jgi:hypothetical protein
MSVLMYIRAYYIGLREEDGELQENTETVCIDAYIINQVC